MIAWHSRFVEKYIELQKLGEADEEKLFVETGKALLAEGVILRRVGEARTVSILLLKLLLELVACLSEFKGRLGFLSPRRKLVFLNFRSNTVRLNILELGGNGCFWEQASCQ